MKFPTNFTNFSAEREPSNFFMFLLKDKDTSSRTPLDLLEHGVVLEQSEAFDSTYSSAIYALVLEAIYFL